MAESTDHHFLRPRELLSARRIAFIDAINLVVYAKLPLVTTLRGKQLIAGYLRRDALGNIELLGPSGADELMRKYATYINCLSYPVGPTHYEPLLDTMCKANESVLPYFFHEHHLMVDRRRRAAMFARTHQKLRDEISTKVVKIQIKESDLTSFLPPGASMTRDELQAYLFFKDVLEWWEDEENIKSHGYLERVILSDSLTASRGTTSSQEMHAPQRLPEPFNTRYLPPLNKSQEPEKTREAASQDRKPPEPVGVVSSAPINRGLLQRILAAFTPAVRSDATHRGDSNEVFGQIDQFKAESSTQASSASDHQRERVSPTGNHADKQHRDAEKQVEAIALEVRLINMQPPPEHEVYEEQQAPSFLLAEKFLKSSRFRVGTPTLPPTMQTESQPLKAADASKSPAETRRNLVTPEAPLREVKVYAAELARPAPHPQLESIGKDDISIAKRESKGGLGSSSEAQEPAQEADAYSDETLLTREEVAIFINRHVNSVDNYRKRPDFPLPVFIGDGPMWKRGQIRKWMDRKSAK